MITTPVRLVSALGLIAISVTGFASDKEGSIESLGTSSLTVGGNTYVTTEATKYEGGLTQFSGLKIGQRIEVDYDSAKSGINYATEIELDDN